MHSVKLIIVLIFTGLNLATGNSDWLVNFESYQPDWLVIKTVNVEPWCVCALPTQGVGGQQEVLQQQVGGVLGEVPAAD